MTIPDYAIVAEVMLFSEGKPVSAKLNHFQLPTMMLKMTG